MKLTLSYEEVLSIIAGTFNVNQSDVIITDLPTQNPKLPSYSDFITEFNSYFDNYKIKLGDKIEAIKHLRQFYAKYTGKPCGLAFSKHAVENWLEFTSYYYENSKLPYWDEGWTYTDTFNYKG